VRVGEVVVKVTEGKEKVDRGAGVGYVTPYFY